MDARMLIAEQFKEIIEKTPYEHSLLRLWDASEWQAAAIEEMAMALAQRARDERSALRQSIVRAHQARRGSVGVNTSKVFLYVRVHRDALEITWREGFFRKGDPKGKPTFRYIKTGKAGTDFRDLIKSAHPDEIPLIEEHEREARKLKGHWQEHISVKRAIRMNMRGRLFARGILSRKTTVHHPDAVPDE